MNRRTARLKRKTSSFNILKKLPLKKVIKVGLKVGIVVVVILTVISVPRMIRINTIDCESQYGPCSQSLSAKLDQAAGKNYFSARNTVRSILEKEFFVEKYTLKLKLPATFEVYAAERKAEVAFIKQGKEEEFILVDSEGVVISYQNKTSLPIIILKHDYNFIVGNQLPDDLLFATKLMIQNFRHYGSRLGYVEASGFQTELTNGITVIFPLKGDMDVLFGSLTLILSRLNTQAQESRIEEVLGELPKTIDLRFNNPVLR